MRLTRVILILSSLLGAGICLFQMYERPLWRYLPLFLFTFLWIIIIFSQEKWVLRTQINIRWLLLAILSAILLTTGFPPYIFFIGTAVGFIPLMVLEREIFSIYGKARPWVLWRYLFASFWLWNIFTTFWVANAALIAGLFANVVNAALMTLPWVVFHILCRRNFNWWRYILLAALWIGFEYLHAHWELSWPWLTLGNCMGAAFRFAQWYEYTGLFGGSVWLWALNIAGYYIMSGSVKQKTYLTGVFLLILLIPCTFSYYLYNTYQLQKPTMEVAIVQPNYEPHFQKFNVPEADQLEKMLRLGHRVVTPQTQLIVYPETVFDPVNLDDFYHANQYPGKLTELLSVAPQANILLGVGGYHTFTKDPGRASIRKSDGIYYEVYNAALMINKDTSDVQEYYKSKFVPGAEIFPYKDILPFLKPIVRKLGGTYEGFAPQDRPTNFICDSIEVAPIICYESIYGYWVAGYVRAGAGLLAIITNDGWWDKTPGHKQHLDLGRLRAIENRRDIVRSANSGISCFINQRGDIIQRTQYGEDAALNGKVAINHHLTFYSRYGDWIIWVVGIVGISVLILNYFKFIREK